MGDECPLSSGKGVCYNGHCLSPAACKKYCADSTAGLCPADVADADCAKHPDVADEYEACMGGLCGVLIN